MKTTRRRRRGALAGLALGLAALAGCQTQYGGMTLPSPRYLQHEPQYIPPSPPFPYTRELARQLEIAAQPEPGAPPVPQVVPPRVPPPFGP